MTTLAILRKVGQYQVVSDFFDILVQFYSIYLYIIIGTMAERNTLEAFDCPTGEFDKPSTDV